MDTRQVPEGVGGNVYTTSPLRAETFGGEYVAEFEVPPRRVAWYEFYPAYAGTEDAVGATELEVVTDGYTFRKTIRTVMLGTRPGVIRR